VCLISFDPPYPVTQNNAPPNHSEVWQREARRKLRVSISDLKEKDTADNLLPIANSNPI
jgi:hypothetical protein